MTDLQHTEGERVLTVAGEDCSGNLGRDIVSEAASIRGSAIRDRILGESVILTLGDAVDESDYLNRLVSIFGTRTQLDLQQFKPPLPSGLMGRIVGLFRAVLWRLMRHPHDWILFHQNAVNDQLLRALELEVRLRQQETHELRNRLSELEGRSPEGAE